MRHDPEKDAAAYLNGEMSSRRRARFEEHILECEECWREIDVGRRGRGFAEAGRETAPQALRELVRTSVASVHPRRRPRRVASAAVAVLAIVAAGVAVVVWQADSDQPREIELLVADFQGEPVVEEAAEASLPRRLGDLRLQSAQNGELDGVSVIAHKYRDPAGHRVVVYQSNVTFPVAEGAEHDVGGQTWTAEVGDVVLFCADRPLPSLVIGDDDEEVTLAASKLGLR